jgi:glucose/arabinose dehydrogenase
MTVEADGAIENRVDRFTLTNDELSDRRTILEGIPGNAIHNGGRLHFGPDGHLYITAGDAGQSDLAQDTESLAGKILRVDENGDIPDDNPFGNEVYSFGHRNPHGRAWDVERRVWAPEQGQRGNDELNLIEAGGNYGWPVIEGDESAEGMESPIVFADGTWAPSGMTILEGSIFFVGLRGGSVYAAELAGGDVGELRTSFTGQFGRLRTIRAHDGALYIATNNTDGRGDPGGADDRILRLDPAALE